MSSALPLRYAIIFRTHFWDAFAERQYQRLKARVRSGDVFILANETAAKLPIPHSNVVSHDEKTILDLGLCGDGYKSMLWFNSDYPLYYFHERYPDYDYYVVCEYDMVVQRDLDRIVQEVAAERIDFVGLTKGEALSEWPHTKTSLQVYTEAQIRKQLISVAVYSNRAIRHLFTRRREMTKLHGAGLLQHWPHCEAFVPTELGMADFSIEEMSRFGPTDHYDWRPAILEHDLHEYAEQGFVHPVLDAPRYAEHRTRHLTDRELFKALRRVPVQVYARPLAQALWIRLRDRLRKLIAGRQKGANELAGTRAANRVPGP